MKKLNYLLITLFLGASTLQLSAAPNNPNQARIDNEKFEILKRNQIDDTDTLAIPFDDREVEDEEEVNQAENKDVFNLPHAR